MEQIESNRFPIQAILTLPGAYGCQRFNIRVVGETGKRYRIMADGPIRLPRKWLMPGVSACVPKAAVTLGAVSA